jgi:isopenicillin N synthase-like dioxygenase
MHNEVGRRLSVILSRILGLQDNHLWDLIPGKGSVLPHSSYCRFQVYHPIEADQRETTQNILPNHTDHGWSTLLPSQPVTCLQMLGKDGEWRYVPYMKGALVCNLGDVMEILSGGILKATRHRGECSLLRILVMMLVMTQCVLQ